MNLEIVTEKPWWFILFCLGLGACYAIFLYRKEHSFDDIKPWLKGLMWFFRFLTISFLSFLLLSPLIRTISREVEKPIIIVAQDNSQSILTGTDSATFKRTYADSFEKMVNELKRSYEVRTYSFGDHVSAKTDFNFSDKQTDMSVLFDEISLKFSNRNVGAIILASDGLYNTGSNPLYGSNYLKAPLYTIALGDTTVKKDLLISKINHNRVAFLGNTFPLEIVMDAHQCAGEKTVLTVLKDSATVFTKNIDITGSNYHLTVPVFPEAKVKGIQHYKIKVSSLQNEINTINNSADVFIEVVESKQKVLIVANAPHPDIGALKSIIESNQNYEVKQVFMRDFDGNVNDYNLVIFHQLPSADNNAKAVLDKLKAADISVLYILGAQSDINAFNSVNSGIKINNFRNRLNEVQATPASDFSLFMVNDELLNFISTLPPLSSPFGVYQSNANNYTLFYQLIGAVKTDQPLLFFNQEGSQKTAVLAGEGIWRWKLKEFSENNNSNYTNELITKVVQYLAVKEKKTPFRISYKNNFTENEPLRFDAELYNVSGELVNTPDVKMTITDANKKSYPFTFSKTDNAYSLNAGNLPVGNYRFRAETKLGDKLYAESGEFSISALQLESLESVANHQLLYTLAEKSGGQMLYPSQMPNLSKLIEAREDVKPVTYSQKKLKDLINLKWVFALLMILISAEWFMRKRSGAY